MTNSNSSMEPIAESHAQEEAAGKEDIITSDIGTGKLDDCSKEAFEDNGKLDNAVGGGGAVQNLVAKRKRGLQLAMLTLPHQRTGEHIRSIVRFLKTVPVLSNTTDPHLEEAAAAMTGQLYQRDQVIYCAGDVSDSCFLVVFGEVLVSEPSEGPPPVGGRWAAHVRSRALLGDEELLSGSGRVVTATCTDDNTLLARVPDKVYRDLAAVAGRAMFEAKVDFLCQINLFKGLPREFVKRIAPCFHEVEFQARDTIVRQGDIADCVYAISAGQCRVLVDPAYKPAKSGPTAVAEADPKKCIQVCVLSAGALVGDVTALQGMDRRTATVMAATEVRSYKVLTEEFMKRVPKQLLQIMSAVAAQKLKYMDDQSLKKAHGHSNIAEGILRGRNLRQLGAKANRRSYFKPLMDEEADYQQLIYSLRRYKWGGYSGEHFEQKPVVLMKQHKPAPPPPTPASRPRSSGNHDAGKVPDPATAASATSALLASPFLTLPYPTNSHPDSHEHTWIGLTTHSSFTVGPNGHLLPAQRASSGDLPQGTGPPSTGYHSASGTPPSSMFAPSRQSTPSLIYGASPGVYPTTPIEGILATHARRNPLLPTPYVPAPTQGWQVSRPNSMARWNSDGGESGNGQVYGGMLKEKVEELLDNLAEPLQKERGVNQLLGRGKSYYRPSVPKGIL